MRFAGCFCVHSGELEIKALLLAASLRKHWPAGMELIGCTPNDPASPGARLNLWASDSIVSQTRSEPVIQSLTSCSAWMSLPKWTGLYFWIAILSPCETRRFLNWRRHLAKALWRSQRTWQPSRQVQQSGAQFITHVMLWCRISPSPQPQAVSAGSNSLVLRRKPDSHGYLPNLDTITATR
jgi:hypothetical protein